MDWKLHLEKICWSKFVAGTIFLEGPVNQVINQVLTSQRVSQAIPRDFTGTHVP